MQVSAIHGNKSQNARQAALRDFRAGKVRMLVATDIAARGIDVPDISHVVNFELPDDAENYVHRIGRTARNGASGVAITLVDGTERDKLRDVERLIRKTLPKTGEIAPPAGQSEAAAAPEDRPAPPPRRKESAWHPTGPAKGKSAKSGAPRKPHSGSRPWWSKSEGNKSEGASGRKSYGNREQTDRAS